MLLQYSKEIGMDSYHCSIILLLYKQIFINFFCVAYFFFFIFNHLTFVYALHLQRGISSSFTKLNVTILSLLLFVSYLNNGFKHIKGR